ncbi:ATP-binding protein [Planomonospora sp. ID82291]|uniref:ATP-binding protein n=1 Tax=Planomonospora sp. ID82291 TaxID=2738136 RepID=UPI0018C35775|nr:ATP-binding protein [Planomonospora sp. ID82291]MBG0818834.1 ATP-binding protein [Planomonospora sp. ID82291]
MTGYPRHDVASARAEIYGWERWLSMLDHLLPPSGLPPWSDGDGRLDQVQMAVRSLRDESCATRTARDFTSCSLRGWGLDHLVDDVTLAVSELVTNALRHGAVNASYAVPRKPTRVVLCSTERSVLCAVTDPCDQGPRLRDFDDEAECGRGLQIVRGVSHTWGWSPLETGGKAVWAAFLPVAAHPRHLEPCR